MTACMKCGKERDDGRTKCPKRCAASFGSPESLVRFWSKVEKTDGCWLWRGTVDGGGYGSFFIANPRRTAKAHRLSYEMHVGPIPAGLDVCHKCDVRVCMNPDHLFVGTRRENVLDAKAKGRLATGRRHGSAIHPGSARHGDTHPYAKLNAAAVRDIRSSPLTTQELAKKYNVHIVTINAVKRWAQWRHVL